MHRLTLNLTRRVPHVPTRLATSSLHRTYATSSPKAAEEASAQSGGSRSKDAAEDAGIVHENLSERTHAPRPKILNAQIPGDGPNKLTAEQQEEVDRHNADFAKRPNRAATAQDDKVDKAFWKGQSGHGKEG